MQVIKKWNTTNDHVSGICVKSNMDIKIEPLLEVFSYHGGNVCRYSC